MNDGRQKLALLVFLAIPAAPCFGSDSGSELRGAEGPHAAEHTVHIPEPLVFDLVRGLGARRGELEINVLGQFPVGGSNNRKIHWAPEVEGAVTDGIALELELPFEGSELEA